MTMVQDVMTADLVACPTTATLAQAAAIMRDRNIGDVLLTADGRLSGIVTDRDIVVRCLAEGASATDAVSRACTSEVTTIDAHSSVEEAAQLMRDHALRRVPVVDHGRAVGIVSLGDLAQVSDPASALSAISAAPPNR